MGPVKQIAESEKGRSVDSAEPVVTLKKAEFLEM